MSSRLHPDYFRVSERRRWSGPLAELLPALKKETRRLAGTWAWRVLPQGVSVALRLRGDGSLELRIARSEGNAGSGWDDEVAVFLREFDCERWARQKNPPELANTRIAVFIEPPLAADAEPEPLDLFGPPAPKRRNPIAEGR